MKLSLRTLQVSNNHSLKVISLIFGYLFWLILVQTQKINSVIEIPVGFYGLKENLQVTAPENLRVTFSGKRIDLSKVPFYPMASAHIDVSNINEPGEYKMQINETDIFLNNKIRLVNYSPETITVKISQKKV